MRPTMPKDTQKFPKILENEPKMIEDKQKVTKIIKNTQNTQRYAETPKITKMIKNDQKKPKIYRINQIN